MRRSASVVAVTILLTAMPTLAVPPQPRDGPYSDSDVAAVVSRSAPAFRECFTRAFKRDPKTRGGTLVLDMEVSPEGAVRTASFGTASTVTSSAIKSCVKGVALKLKFAPKGKLVPISTNLVYKDGDGCRSESC